MRIVAVTAFRQWQPFAAGPYTCSGGRAADGFDSTLVRVDTDAGVAGWGEAAPLGAFYDPAFAEGLRAGLALVAPAVIGLDPRQSAVVGARLDAVLSGHPYVKSALDMACWDAAARAAGVPLCVALGGRFDGPVALYRSVSQAEPAVMAAAAARLVADGYRRLQVKVGLDVADDVERLAAVADAVPRSTVLFADANGTWTTGQALAFLRATRDLDYTLEQPCTGLEANAVVRRRCDRPFVLDESIDGLPALLRAVADGLVDGVTLKIARLGGVTRTRLVRDVAVAAGLGVTIEDTGGAELDTAATAHLMRSTPAGARLHTVDFVRWVTVGHAPGTSFGDDPAVLVEPPGPGLGVDVDVAALGDPVLSACA